MSSKYKAINMNILFIIFLSIFCLSENSSAQSLIINEVYPTPPKGDAEWIEIYNNTEAEISYPILFIADSKASKKINYFSLESKTFCVITKDTNALKIKYLIDANVKLYQLSLPSLNNTTDNVILRNQDTITLDSIFYNAKWGQSGKSLERSDYANFNSDNQNWKTSIDTSGATPGRINSTFKRDYDIALSPAEWNSSGLSFIARNLGKNRIENAELKIILSSNNSSEQEFHHSYFTLDSNAEIKHFFASNKFIEYFQNQSQLLAKISITSKQDSYKQNDSLVIDIYFDSIPKEFTGELFIEQNPFNLSKEKICNIYYQVPFESATLSISLYDLSGNQVVVLKNADIITAQGKIEFYGLDANSNRLLSGAYVLLLEASDSQSGKVISQKKMLVIGN